MVASRESHRNKGARLTDLANQMHLMRGLESSPQPELNSERGKARLPLLMRAFPSSCPVLRRAPRHLFAHPSCFPSCRLSCTSSPAHIRPFLFPLPINNSSSRLSRPSAPSSTFFDLPPDLTSLYLPSLTPNYLAASTSLRLGFSILNPHPPYYATQLACLTLPDIDFLLQTLLHTLSSSPYPNTRRLSVDLATPNLHSHLWLRWRYLALQNTSFTPTLTLEAEAPRVSDQCHVT